MRLIYKIAIYGMIFGSTVIVSRKSFIVEYSTINDLVFHACLLGAYFALLYSEIRTRVRRHESQKQIRWAGFHFTFWAGLFWGILFSSPSMDSLFSHPKEFFTYLYIFILSGAMLGIVGMAITQIMVLFVFKQPEEV